MSNGIIGNLPFSILSCWPICPPLRRRRCQVYFSLLGPQSRCGQNQLHGQNMAAAGTVWQGALLATATGLRLAATKSRQFSALQNLTFRALIPPALLQVPETQYPAVSGLTHLAATGVDAAAPNASVATMSTGKGRFFNILIFVGKAGRV
jgi:hypothetical protein